MPGRSFLRTAFAGSLLVAALSALGTWGWRAWDPPASRCSDADLACLTRAVRDHPAASVAFWGEWRQRSVAERVGPAPGALVDFLALANRVQGYPQRPQVPAPDPAFDRDVRQAMAEIPPRVWQVVASGLLGIHFVNDLGSSGFTMLVRDAAGRAAGALVVLDAGVLATISGNAWATWKENTPFLWDGVFRLQATIADPADDGRVAGIRYVLLHELGHVLSVGRDFHPSWDEPVPASLDRYPFAGLSWSAHPQAQQYRPNGANGFAQRERLVYYLGARLQAEERAPVYRALERTAFPSLYAATSPGDDFAESFASYVHVVLLRQPWRITVTEGGEIVQTFGACWGQRRCADKQAMLERILGSGSAGESVRRAAD